MRTVKILSIRLQFFKGIKALEIQFGDNTEIEGRNASGKSTIVDAFFWLLWGKNAKGESDSKFLIKTVDNEGIEIPYVDHTVTAKMEVDGNLITISRSLIPDYDKDDRLKGNHTEFFWNEVPLKKSEFEAKVREIIDEQVFKLITNPYAFLMMPWQDQRAMLLKMAGDVNDTQVAGNRKDFVDLLAKLSGKTLEEYKKEILSKLQKVNESMQSIPTRIDEVKIGMPAAPDYNALEELKSKLEAKIEDLNEMIEEEKPASNDELVKLQKTLGELQMKQAEILSKAQADERTRIHEQNAIYNKAEAEQKEILDKVEMANRKLQSEMSVQKLFKTNIENAIDNLNSKLAELRTKWSNENLKVFNAEETLVCPLYGHGCKDSEACARYEQEEGEAYENFAKSKRETMANINNEGKALKVQLEEKTKELDEICARIQKGLDKFVEEKEGYEKQIKELQDVMAENPKKPLISTVKGEDIQEYVQIGQEIAHIASELDDMAKVKQDDEKSSNLKYARAELQKPLDEVKMKLALKDQIAKAESRVKNLEDNLRILGGQKATLENMRITIQNFEVARMDEVSRRVNGMFHMVTWQMFQRQMNGEQNPTCIALVKGVRWSDANTASRINAGIDVASTLAKAFGVSAPMFIDNAECSGDIYNPNVGQRIILSHVKGKELTVNY